MSSLQSSGGNCGSLLIRLICIKTRLEWRNDQSSCRGEWVTIVVLFERLSRFDWSDSLHTSLDRKRWKCFYFSRYFSCSESSFLVLSQAQWKHQMITLKCSILINDISFLLLAFFDNERARTRTHTIHTHNTYILYIHMRHVKLQLKFNLKIWHELYHLFKISFRKVLHFYFMLHFYFVV